MQLFVTSSSFGGKAVLTSTKQVGISRFAICGW
jgi:hypothetical protein